MFKEEEHGGLPSVSRSLVSMKDKGRKQGKGLEDVGMPGVRAFPVVGRILDLYIKSNEEPWKDLNLQVTGSGLCFQQSLLAAEKWRSVNMRRPLRIEGDNVSEGVMMKMEGKGWG